MPEKHSNTILLKVPEKAESSLLFRNCGSFAEVVALLRKPLSSFSRGMLFCNPKV